MIHQAIGTHLDPQWLFDIPVGHGEVAPNEIAGRISVTANAEDDVVVTRASGLFVEHPTIPDRNEALAFVREAVVRFNLVICELNLVGVVSSPASTAEIATAEIGDADVVVRSAAGSMMDRTMPLSARTNSMIQHDFRLQMDRRILDDIQGVPRARALAAVAPSLPHFVAAAYTFYARRLLAEGLINTWIAIEQILSHMWRQEHVAGAEPGSRRERLTDQRTFSAAVQIEVLQTAGVLDQDLADTLHRARGARNKLAHEGQLVEAGCEAGIDALVKLLVTLTKMPVARPSQWNEEIPW